MDELRVPNPAQPPAYKDRRAGLIAFGVIQILIGLAWFAMLALTIVILPGAPQQPGQRPIPHSFTVAIGVFYGLFAIFFIVVGIGSIQARRWARIATLIVSWFWLGTGVLTLLVSLLILPVALKTATQQGPHPENAPPVALMMGFFLIFGGFIYVVMPGSFLLFYHSKHVKATCDAGAGAPARPSPRPLLVSIIFWFFFVATVISYPVVFLTRQAIPLFGTFLTGRAAWTYHTIFVGLYLYALWEFYWLRIRGWWIVFVLLFYGPLNASITIAHFGWAEYLHRSVANSPTPHDPTLDGIIMPVVLTCMAVAAVVFAGLLLSVRASFTSEGLLRHATSS